MKLDINDNATWHPKYIGTKVWLDGEEVANACAFDTQEGWVNFAAQDEKGFVLTSPDNPDEIWIKREFGKVQYQLPEGI